MSDEPLENENQDSEPGRLRKMYEEAAAKAAAAEARLAEVERKDVFRDAGLDPTNPLHQAVINGYTGEINGEAVKGFVDGLGLTQTVTTPPANVIQPQQPAGMQVPSTTDVMDQQAHERLQAATAGDGVAPDGTADQKVAILQAMDAASRANNVQELNALSVQWAKLGGEPIAPLT